MPVGAAKFDLNRRNDSSLRGEKPDFWPVSKFNTGSLPLRGNPAGKNSDKHHIFAPTARERSNRRRKRSPNPWIIGRVGSIIFKMYFNYKIQITFLKSNSNTFFNYFGYHGQNTKYKIHFLKVIKIPNNKVSVIAVRQLGVCLTSVCSVHRA